MISSLDLFSTVSKKTNHVSQTAPRHVNLKQIPDAVHFTGKSEPNKTNTKGLSLNNERSRRLHQAKALQTMVQLTLLEERPLGKHDKKWLGRLRDVLGAEGQAMLNPSDVSAPLLDLKSPFTPKWLNKDLKRRLTMIDQALTVLIKAADYQPLKKQLGATQLTVHNPKIAGALLPEYTSASFKDLNDLANANNVFDINIDEPTGLVQTADTDDDIMMQFWVTDSIRNGDRQRTQDPASWNRMLDHLAQYYQNEQPAFQAVFDDPQSYYTGGRNTGVGHIIDPETLQSYDWLSKNRLESHGLALRAFCETLTGAYGETVPLLEPTDTMVDAMANLARYFVAINYDQAPTTSAWEELTFNGTAWDTIVITQALRKFKNILFNPDLDNNETVSEFRSKLSQRHNNALFQSPKKLYKAIKAGEARIQELLVNNTDTIPMEHPERPFDATSAFISASGYQLDGDPLKNAQLHLRLLAQIENTIMRDNGLVRYAPFPATLSNGSTVITSDGYLSLNGLDIALDKQGKINLFKEAYEEETGQPYHHIEPSTPDAFHTRASLGVIGREAEWFNSADMAKGYAVTLNGLLDAVEQGYPKSPEVMDAIQQSYKGACELINRGYARITGKNSIRANGKPCPAWKVPETYQWVSDINGNHVMLPGINTPLAWGTSSLFAASESFKESLSKLEAMALI